MMTEIVKRVIMEKSPRSYKIEGILPGICIDFIETMFGHPAPMYIAFTMSTAPIIGTVHGKLIHVDGIKYLITGVDKWDSVVHEHPRHLYPTMSRILEKFAGDHGIDIKRDGIYYSIMEWRVKDER